MASSFFNQDESEFLPTESDIQNLGFSPVDVQTGSACYSIMYPLVQCVDTAWVVFPLNSSSNSHESVQAFIHPIEGDHLEFFANTETSAKPNPNTNVTVVEWKNIGDDHKYHYRREYVPSIQEYYSDYYLSYRINNYFVQVKIEQERKPYNEENFDYLFTIAQSIEDKIMS
jgi:hypothetical protein